jgi:sugar phosphate isomerase/epimerase
MTVRLALYSISLAGGFYDGPALSLLEVIQGAREWGYDGIEVSAKRPHGNPMDLDDRRRREVVDAARQAGVALAAVASYSDFSSPLEEPREAQLLMARETIRLAAEIGAPIVRLFAAWPGVARRDGRWTYDLVRYDVAGTRQYFDRYPGVTAIERWRLVRDGLEEMARYAQSCGVTLALQNHEPVTRDWEDVLDFVQEVGSPALKVSLDAPMLKDQSAEGMARAVREVGGLMVHTHFGGEYDEPQDAQHDESVPVPRPLSRGGRVTDYLPFLRAIKQQGYAGFAGYELCHPCLVGHRYFGLEEAQVRRAARFMRHMLASA